MEACEWPGRIDIQLSQIVVAARWAKPEKCVVCRS
jgi:hypothetical protein